MCQKTFHFETGLKMDRTENSIRVKIQRKKAWNTLLREDRIGKKEKRKGKGGRNKIKIFSSTCVKQTVPEEENMNEVPNLSFYFST